jgi:hypothetical protein
MPPRLKPPIGLPTSVSLADNEAWSSLVTNQLADVRKAAENWRNGLVALIGLVATFSVIKGANDLSGLARWAGYSVGILLSLALVCAIFGAWKSLAAAYGTPSVISLEQFRAVGGADGFRLDLGTKTVSNLLWARRATIATVILVALAVGLTWYGPRPAFVILNVERKSLPNVCGKLVSSQNGEMEIKPSDTKAVRIRMVDTTAMHAVDECP